MIRKSLLQFACIVLVLLVSCPAVFAEESFWDDLLAGFESVFAGRQVVLLQDQKKRKVVYRLPYAAIVDRAAAQNRLDPMLLHSIIRHESNYFTGAVSHSGALGLMQLMPATAAELRVDPLNPSQNVDGGARYYRQLYDRFGNHYLSLVAYNSGPGRVAQGTIYRESDQYARRVITTWKFLRARQNKQQHLNRRKEQ